MEQEKSNDVLVVKSDKEWMRYIYRDKTVALLMSMVLLSGTWVGIFLYGVSNGTVKKSFIITIFPHIYSQLLNFKFIPCILSFIKPCFNQNPRFVQNQLSIYISTKQINTQDYHY